MQACTRPLWRDVRLAQRTALLLAAAILDGSLACEFSSSLALSSLAFEALDLIAHSLLLGKALTFRLLASSLFSCELFLLQYESACTCV
mgnify:CR=1 FL=1